MVGMLLRNETDVVVAGLTYTKGRFAAIDYTVPVFPRLRKTAAISKYRLPRASNSLKSICFPDVESA